MIVRTGTVTTGSKIVTGLTRTADLRTTLYTYSDYLPVSTFIDTIDSDSQITLSANALTTSSISIEFTEVEVGVYHERNCALMDTQNICNERGKQIKFILRDETKVTRDTYNSIKKKTNDVFYWWKAYPIMYNPNDDQLSNSGLKERSEVIITLPAKNFIDNSINFQDININRSVVLLDGEKFEIKDKARASQNADVFLYYNFGLNKR